MPLISSLSLMRRTGGSNRCSIVPATCLIAVAVRVSFSASANTVVDLLNEDISRREYHELMRSPLLRGCSNTAVENSEKRTDFALATLDGADEDEATFFSIGNIIAFLFIPPCCCCCCCCRCRCCSRCGSSM
jgi:hypothetical protein